ncbi:hypothetical protein H5202_08400 [Shewanella sp. SG41-4]|uniref:hypothetical protein n=1 Tax=Shewanella sp. SG41-4 TaxID=2760976 RepID=UPI001602A777|nr:hypothetical protein [Shewanella sp. SG41-4]MBB1438701.1 hypothetical protein [Shewanella sp. SG41-4]
MGKVKLKVKRKRNYRIHNDLSNGAFHFKKELERRLVDGNESGITYVSMSCLIMLAFAIEAKINFIGEKCVEGWIERKPFREKLKQVCKALEINLDENGLRQTIYLLNTCRDDVAHGKPITLSDTYEVIVPQGEEHHPKDLIPKWMEICTAKKTIGIYADINDFLQQLLEKSGLGTFDATSNGEFEVGFVENVES